MNRDDVGFPPLDPHEANLFFPFVSTRQERGSIVLGRGAIERST